MNVTPIVDRSHVGLNYIAADYVPKSTLPAVRFAIAGATGLTVLGLLKLNFEGDGLCATVKRLWRPNFKPAVGEEAAVEA